MAIKFTLYHKKSKESYSFVLKTAEKNETIILLGLALKQIKPYMCEPVIEQWSEEEIKGKKHIHFILQHEGKTKLASAAMNLTEFKMEQYSHNREIVNEPQVFDHHLSELAVKDKLFINYPVSAAIVLQLPPVKVMKEAPSPLFLELDTDLYDKMDDQQAVHAKYVETHSKQQSHFSKSQEKLTHLNKTTLEASVKNGIARLEENSLAIERLLTKHTSDLARIKESFIAPKEQTFHQTDILSTLNMQCVKEKSETVRPLESKMRYAIQYSALEYFKELLYRHSSKLTDALINQFNDIFSHVAKIKVAGATPNYQLEFLSTFVSADVAALETCINHIDSTTYRYKGYNPLEYTASYYLRRNINLLPQESKVLFSLAKAPYFAWNSTLQDKCKPLTERYDITPINHIRLGLTTIDQNLKQFAESQKLLEVQILVLKKNTDTLIEQDHAARLQVAAIKGAGHEKIENCANKLEQVNAASDKIKETSVSQINRAQTNHLTVYIKALKKALKALINEEKNLPTQEDFIKPKEALASITDLASAKGAEETIDDFDKTQQNVFNHIDDHFQSVSFELEKYTQACNAEIARKAHESRIVETAAKLIECLQDTTFWHKQVRGWGGVNVAAANNTFTSVPKGIAEMKALITTDAYSLDYATANAFLEKLQGAAKIAHERSGWKCCFHVRKQSTDALYGLIHELDIKTMTESIDASLNKIHSKWSNAIDVNKLNPQRKIEDEIASKTASPTATPPSTPRALSCPASPTI